MLRSHIKKLLNLSGYDIMHLPTDQISRKRIDLLRKYNIDLVFDIGANTGQFATQLRSLGYTGKIISFEPLHDAFSQLSKEAQKDPMWEAVNTAIGNYDGEITMHIAQNSYSSSILNILPLHVLSAPDSAYIGQVKVPIHKIDSIINNYYQEGNNLLLKIDTQGYERQVIEGFSKSIGKILGLQLELSLQPLYEGETLMQDMIDLLRKKGFKIMLLESGHLDYTSGEVLQVEGHFFK